MKLTKCTGFTIKSYGTPSSFVPGNISANCGGGGGGGSGSGGLCDCPECPPGDRGNGIADISVNEKGRIIFEFTSGFTGDAGPVEQGDPGEPGTGIDDIFVDGNGHITVEFGDGSTGDAGPLNPGPPGDKGNKGVIGDQGFRGPKGEPGEPGSAANCLPTKDEGGGSILLYLVIISGTA